jgi:phosphate transport system ATP-binding protein
MVNNSEIELSEPPDTSSISDRQIEVNVENLSFYYHGNIRAIDNVSLPIYARQVTTLIGASGCGKTTLLHCFNRMHDLTPGNRYEGSIWLKDGSNLLGSNIDPIEVRMRVGMVLSQPNILPKSIYENVAYGLRVRGERSRDILDESVETALKRSNLWDEVKDRLHKSASNLSSGQQQRLCFARALAPTPTLILLDEPTFGLDLEDTLKIEAAIDELTGYTTAIVVTHSIHQAARISDYTVFMHHGKAIEFDRTRQIFIAPNHQLTSDYMSGKLG